MKKYTVKFYDYYNNEQNELTAEFESKDDAIIYANELYEKYGSFRNIDIKGANNEKHNYS